MLGWLSLSIVVVVVLYSHISRLSLPPQTASSTPFQAPAIYFNTTQGTDALTPRIIQHISQAKESIDLALYAFDNSDIITPLLERCAAGVRVSVVADIHKKDEVERIFTNTSCTPHIIYAGAGTSGTPDAQFMHHKFALIDRRTDKPLLIAGSFNWTYTQARNDLAYIWESYDPRLIEVFSHEFSRLEKGLNGMNKFFDPTYDPGSFQISYASSLFEVWLGPGVEKRSFENRIVSLIKGATRSIDVLSRELTSDHIADLLIEKAREGIAVRVIVDDAVMFQPYSSLPRLITASRDIPSLEIVSDISKSLTYRKDSLVFSPFNPFIHEQTLLIDNTIVASGTSNWSTRGFYRNDESNIVTTDPLLVKAFQNAFSLAYRELLHPTLSFVLEKNRIHIPQNTPYMSYPVIAYQAASQNFIVCKTTKNQGDILISDECLGSPLIVFEFNPYVRRALRYGYGI